MVNTDLPLVNLDGYNFNCQRCGECCKVLIKTTMSKKQLIYRRDYQGKLTKSPFTTTTVYYHERGKITEYVNKNIENYDELFIPFASFFLKDFPFEFIYAYQVKTEDKWCVFYDKKIKSCKIYPVRPLTCKIYPLYIDHAIKGGTIVDQPNITKCSAVDEEIRNRYPNIQNLMKVRFDPRFDTYKTQFPEQSRYFKKGVYIERKINTFLDVWNILFINPLELKPGDVRDYEQVDMSLFWSWIGENKENLDRKFILETVRLYKSKILDLNELFNLDIYNFL